MQPFANPMRLYTIVSAHLSGNRPAVDIYCSTTVPGGGTRPANK